MRTAIALAAFVLAMLARPAAAADPTADALVAAYGTLGGRAVLGPIIGAAFRRGDEPFLYLPTSRLVLQAPVGGGEVAPVNTMEWLSAAGKDGWLDAVKGIPLAADDAAPYPDTESALMARRSWLSSTPIAVEYFANGEREALRLYGLPTSRPERRGPFVAQRFQRGALQLWVDAVPGSPEPGSVVPVMGGDLLQEAGLLPGGPRPRLPDAVAPGEVISAHVAAGHLVAITYDTGSIDTGLQSVLDTLAARGLSATFFVTGDFTRRYEWALPKIIEMGHEVANHTVTHPDLTTIGNAIVAREVDNLDAILTARGAPPPIWFRPPFGAYDRRVASVLGGRGYPLVMWRLDLGDWRDDISAFDVINIGRRIRGGDIVVTHGGLPKTAQAMPQVLDELAARGLKQVTLTELYAAR